MDKSKVKSIVERYFQRFFRALDLSGWRITFFYGPIPSKSPGSASRAQIVLKTRSKIAAITFNPEELCNEQEVVETLRHELLHFMDGYYEIYRDSVHEFLDDNARESTDKIFYLASEHMVLMLEGMLDFGLKIPVREMGKRPTGKRKKSKKSKKR